MRGRRSQARPLSLHVPLTIPISQCQNPLLSVDFVLREIKYSWRRLGVTLFPVCTKHQWVRVDYSGNCVGRTALQLVISLMILARRPAGEDDAGPIYLAGVRGMSASTHRSGPLPHCQSKNMAVLESGLQPPIKTLMSDPSWLPGKGLLLPQNEGTASSLNTYIGPSSACVWHTGNCSLIAPRTCGHCRRVRVRLLPCAPLVTPASMTTEDVAGEMRIDPREGQSEEVMVGWRTGGWWIR